VFDVDDPSDPLNAAMPNVGVIDPTPLLGPGNRSTKERVPPSTIPGKRLLWATEN
jgi:hypothetical protein